MDDLKLKMVKEVIEHSKLPNMMVAEAFGFKDEKDLNIEFLDCFGMSVSEFRKNCREAKIEDAHELEDKKVG